MTVNSPSGSGRSTTVYVTSLLPWVGLPDSAQSQIGRSQYAQTVSPARVTNSGGTCGS